MASRTVATACYSAHYHVQSGPKTDPTMSQMHPLHILLHYVFRAQFNISLPSTPIFPEVKFCKHFSVIYGLEGLGSESRQMQDLLFCKTYRPAMGSTQPPVQWVPGFFTVLHIGIYTWQFVLQNSFITCNPHTHVINPRVIFAAQL